MRSLIATLLIITWLSGCGGDSGEKITAPSTEPVYYIGPAERDIIIGEINKTVAPNPRVVVLDALNNFKPLANIKVRFEVTAGGGSIGSSASTAVTDADGYASPGAWTLGPNPGTNEITATIEHAVLPGTIRAFALARMTPMLPLKAITAGHDHTCGLTLDGTAYCWGSNKYGQIGNGASVDSMFVAAVPVAGGLKFDAIEAGDFHTCGLSGETAYCWGNNDWGQLGEGTTSSHSTPVQVYGGYKFKQLSASGATTNFAYVGQTCGVTRDGATMCWGIAATPSSFVSTSTPRVIAPAFHFREITTGGMDVCGITDAQAGYCWQDRGAESTPIALTTAVLFATIVGGETHKCGVSTSGKGYCWGYNSVGQLGDGTFGGAERQAPVAIAPSLNLQSFALGMFHTCALTTSGEAYCWGWNLDGQLGNGDIHDRAAPGAVSTTIRFKQLAAGSAHTCGITETGEAYCWGSSTFGELGTGLIDFGRSKPSRVLLR